MLGKRGRSPEDWGCKEKCSTLAFECRRKKPLFSYPLDSVWEQEKLESRKLLENAEDLTRHLRTLSGIVSVSIINIGI